MEWVFTLYDDESVRKKLEVMSKWDAVMDDSRNPETDIMETIEAMLELGKRYKLSVYLEEIS